MKHRKRLRPAHCEPGSMTDARELGERLRLSRERLAGSELAGLGMAWRLWAACADATFGYCREGDQIYVTTLAKSAGLHRSKAGPLLRRFDELGVFGWQAAPRGSHGISELGLPHVAPAVHEDAHAPPTVREEAPSCTAHGALQSNEVMSVEHSTHNVSIDTGTQHSSLIGASDHSIEDWKAEGRARPRAQAGPELQDMSREDLIRLAHARPEAHEAIRAELARRERFEPWHGDGRGDGVGDDERSQLRWQAANPRKTRTRE